MKKILFLMILFAGTACAQYPGLWKYNSDSIKVANTIWMPYAKTMSAQRFFGDTLTLGVKPSGSFPVTITKKVNTDIANMFYLRTTNTDNTLDTLATRYYTRTSNKKYVDTLTNQNIYGIKKFKGNNWFDSGVVSIGNSSQTGEVLVYSSAFGYPIRLTGASVSASRVLYLPAITTTDTLISNKTGRILLVALTGNQTIGGDKSFTGNSFLYNGTAETFTVGSQADATKGSINLLNGSTLAPYSLNITAPTLTANRTITFPNVTGTVALTSDLSTYATQSWVSGNYAPIFSGLNGTYTIQTGTPGSGCHRDFTFTNGVLTSVGVESCL